MSESTNEVRADIEATRARMSNAITELEKRADVTQKIRDNPWPALALAFGAGLALSASGADVHASRLSGEAAQKTGSKLGSALDNVLATAVGGMAAALQGRVDDAVKEVMHMIQGNDKPHPSMQNIADAGYGDGVGQGSTAATSRAD